MDFWGGGEGIKFPQNNQYQFSIKTSTKSQARSPNSLCAFVYHLTTDILTFANTENSRKGRENIKNVYKGVDSLSKQLLGCQ